MKFSENIRRYLIIQRMILDDLAKGLVADARTAKSLVSSSHFDNTIWWTGGGLSIGVPDYAQKRLGKNSNYILVAQCSTCPSDTIMAFKLNWWESIIVTAMFKSLQGYCRAKVRSMLNAWESDATLAAETVRLQESINKFNERFVNGRNG